MWSGNHRIAGELAALPRGRFEQNLLRAVFQNMRANDLGRSPAVRDTTTEETLLRAIALIRSEFPNFEPLVDWLVLASLRNQDA